MNYSLRNLRGDLFGGITASVVALPLALAFGVASGLGPMAGLYGAISVGFFAAVFGGTRSQISGPTGPMAIAMAVIVSSHAETLAEALTIVVMSGLMQILFGALRIGRFITYTPYSVISGFMSGIGVIIIVVQILPFLGHPVASSVPSSLAALPELMGRINLDALVIGTVSLLTGIFWPGPLRKALPPTLAAMIAGIVVSLLWPGGAPIIGEVPTGLPSLQLPVLSLAFLTQALQPALILALVGSIDSLLTSLIADSLTRGQHNADRELVGQGIGNVVSGLVGGMPGAGAPVGTVVNIRGGGRSRVSGILCASILLALVLGLGQYVEQVPHAVLAGIMIKVGWDIIDWRFLTRIHRVRPVYLLLALITLGLTVFVDLVIAVTIGLIAAGLVGSRHLERLQLDNVVSLPFLDRSFLTTSPQADPFAARVGLVALRGQFSVASSNKLVQTIGADIRDHEVVVFDFSETAYLDDSAAMVVDQMLDIAADENTEVIVMGLTGTVADHLLALDIFHGLPEDRFVATLDDAKERARSLLED
ncbi:MAG: SulP family inorganic anion transporter [Gammaproteobacteria bacterium]|nr:SulP family inorganic anion transporter [Gammaproteobacteria bacterium]